MLINGVWHLCDDEMTRPVINAEILTRDSSWIKVPFLVDTGADQTVFSADILAALHLSPVVAEEQIGGVGGIVSARIVETQIRLTHAEGGQVTLRGQYAGVTEVDALDMSVLGRDVMNLFAVIVDWPQQVVRLLGQKHQYPITRLP